MTETAVSKSLITQRKNAYNIRLGILCCCFRCLTQHKTACMCVLIGVKIPAMNTNSKLYLTPKQAAQLLQLHINTVRKMLLTGQLPGFKIGDNWRIDPDDIAKLKEVKHQN